VESVNDVETLGQIGDGAPPRRAALRDIGRLVDFMELFCRKKHRQRPRRRVQASGCVEPYLQRKCPVLCADCTRLFLHGAVKRVLCPFEKQEPFEKQGPFEKQRPFEQQGPPEQQGSFEKPGAGAEKPNCADCEIRCFPDDYRKAMREVMRFSGWRLILRGRFDLIWGMLGFKK